MLIVDAGIKRMEFVMPGKKQHSMRVDALDPSSSLPGPWWCAACKTLAYKSNGGWACLKGCDAGFVRVRVDETKKAAD